MRIDSRLLTVLWLSILALLAYDIATSPFPGVEYAAMIAFIFVALAGVSWRRFWRRQMRSMENEQMRRHTRQYGQKDGEA